MNRHLKQKKNQTKTDELHTYALDAHIDIDLPAEPVDLEVKAGTESVHSGSPRGLPRQPSSCA